MSVVTLNELSFESDELLSTDVDPSGAYEGSTDVANVGELEQAQQVLDVYRTILQRGKICRDDIERIQPMADAYPSIQKLLKRYPASSFSREPSMTNYEVSNESFVKTAYEAVVRALREILRFCVEGFKRLWRYLSQNAQRTTAVDDLKNRLHDLQNFIVEVDRVMAESEVSTEYVKVRNEIFESERHNISKGWNQFKQLVIEDEAGTYSILTQLSAVLRDGLPPFTIAVENFLTELANATTESDVKVAVARMELFCAPSGALAALAHAHGWRPGSVKIADNMTPFHATAAFLKSVMRSWGNHRIEMPAKTFSAAIVSMKNLSWGDIVNDVIRTSGARAERTVSKINAFNAQSLKPGMEDTYAAVLTPFFSALLSIIQGYTTLENCLGDLITQRDNATIAVSKSTLTVVKELDKFLKKNNDKITIFGRGVISNQRKNVFASMTK